ncbi:heparinase II/III family protein [Tellurirhabdus bombi]|uniref:heparinase II/III family protein n=1 Tax=Tellurirhabdus bombi TaxID=2907205 RepID=UPI001F3654EB|nr:alginate lyase family protein [Tellurirhabdus bombi]
MRQKVKLLRQLWQNMGWRYVRYRLGHEVKRRTGLLKKNFPTTFTPKTFITQANWKQSAKPFFFVSREKVAFPKQKTPSLQRAAQEILAGNILFFNADYKPLGLNYDWVTNPDNSYTYPLKHWTEIPDFSPVSGDIKAVWEKSRFAYILTLIRYDYHFEHDCSDFVVAEILSWIAANPLNQGPNYRCSQEISLRVLNWIFALYYYRDSPALTEEAFSTILNSIHWQIQHVYKHINFSRIAVRNNHAITETLALYLVGLLMPFFPESNQWHKDGKRWFEEEIAYQIYEDGSFLQFSMNYHRVVVQLLTWALQLSKINKETLSPVVQQRAEASIHFLRACQDQSGWLPNYGANDGALFFPLNNCGYRDYRPQLQALASCVAADLGYGPGEWQEDAYWYGLHQPTNHVWQKPPEEALNRFDLGGYYTIRDGETLTFVRCGRHKDRPSQADNLHLDIWVKGRNILRDAGSYKYNTEEAFRRFFNGTASHNTVMLGHYDQMEKGPRFIWFDWSQAVEASLSETAEAYIFEGTIQAFAHVSPGITHTRKVLKYKNSFVWEITDIFSHTAGLPLQQIWNPSDDFSENCQISASDAGGKKLVAEMRDGWYSGLYGVKVATQQLVFSTQENQLTTRIEYTITD